MMETNDKFFFKGFDGKEVELSIKSPVQIRTFAQEPMPLRFYVTSNHLQHDAEITKDGIFKVVCTPNDQNAIDFINLVNYILSNAGRNTRLTKMEIVDREELNKERSENGRSTNT